MQGQRAIQLLIYVEHSIDNGARSLTIFMQHRVRPFFRQTNQMLFDIRRVQKSEIADASGSDSNIKWTPKSRQNPAEFKLHM